MTTHPATAPSLAPPAPPTGPLAPVAPADRFGSVDTLRGVAVLGILAMNILAFSQPMASYLNPMAEGLAPYHGEFRGLNGALWWVQYLFFDLKMITIFSMLFGAGLVLMDDRARAGHGAMASGPGGFAGVYYRRLLVLGAIGLLHAYVIWFGDVLFIYAVCGLLLYPLRRLRPRTLLVLGGVLLLLGLAVSSLFGLMIAFFRDQALEARAAIAPGAAPTDEQRGWIDAWEGMNASFNPSAETVAQEVATMRGPAAGVLWANAMHALMMHLFLFPFFFFFRTVGVMLIGMALMKLDVFSALRSGAFYRGLLVVGYGLGFPLLVAGGLLLIRTRFDPADWYLYTGQFNNVASVLVALGHVGVVMLVVKSGVLAGLTRRLAAVGRMAFTNYLAQSLICTTIFYGWGLGYFGALERSGLALVVLGVWLAQLAWSPWWLARFRFGPAEWLWRSLTYAKAQPMRV